MTTFVQQWTDAWGAPDPARIGELCAPDVELTWPGQTDPIRGQDAWRARVAAVLTRFPDLTLTPTAHTPRDDVVFISWRAEATVAGTRVSWPGIDRMRLANGVVAESLVTFDTAALR